MKAMSLAAAMGALALLLASGVAQAQLYHYKDASGRTVYSDTPPPAGTPAGNILKAPKLNPNAPAVPKAPTATVGKDGKEVKNDGPKSVAEKEADYKKRMAENDKKAKEDDAKAKADQQRQQACAGMQQNLAALQTGQRVRKMDANGNPYFVEDNERAADVARMQQSMADAKCGG